MSKRGDVDAEAARLALAGIVRASDDARTAVTDLTSSGLARVMAANARILGIRDLQMRYIDGDPLAGTDVPDRYGTGAWLGSVQVSYRLPVDVGATEFDVAFVFVPHGHGPISVAATGGHGTRGALWLGGPIRVRRDARTLLITAAKQPAQRYWHMARRAVGVVNRVLPAWRGTFIAEVPRDQGQLEELTDAPTGSYRLVAGVTATVDGSLTRRTPLHSFFNPQSFGGMNEEGSQLVVSHEATLQATRAPLVDMPTWVKEGFADYVALAHAHVPLRIAAHDIAAQTRRHGPPRHLPTDGDFDSTRDSIGQINAVYQSSWLACRYVADTWGEPVLIQLYRAFDRGERTGVAFRTVLGIDQAQFVQAWEGYLGRLAASLKTTHPQP